MSNENPYRSAPERSKTIEEQLVERLGDLQEGLGIHIRAMRYLALKKDLTLLDPEAVVTPSPDMRAQLQRYDALDERVRITFERISPVVEAYNAFFSKYSFSIQSEDEVGQNCRRAFVKELIEKNSPLLKMLK